jgi:hypothetical protein
MNMRKLLPFAMLVLLGATPVSAQGITPFEFYKAPLWTMYQQYWKHAFDACVAERNELDNGQRLSIGRAITGEDFIMVHQMKSLFNEGEATLAGKVWINGKTPYDFSGVKPFDSVSVPGEKYVTIYLASGFVDQFAKANSVEVEFSRGRSKHGLKGSKDVIARLNECMDRGLTRVMDAPPPAPPEPPPLRTPLNWVAGKTSENSRYIAIKLPASAKMPSVFMAFVETTPGRFDIRVRNDEAGIANRVDLNAAENKRAAINALINGQPAFATLAVFGNKQVDILDVPAADLLKLSAAGPFTIKPLDASLGADEEFVLTPDASFGAGAIVNSAPVPPPPEANAELTLDKLVGTYYVRGVNPNGAYYYGTADTMMEGNNLRINWKWTNEKTDTAVANMLQNVVTAVVTGLNAPAIYTIGKDGTWRGTWENGKGTEIMVPKL